LLCVDEGVNVIIKQVSLLDDSEILAVRAFNTFFLITQLECALLCRCYPLPSELVSVPSGPSLNNLLMLNTNQTYKDLVVWLYYLPLETPWHESLLAQLPTPPQL